MRSNLNPFELTPTSLELTPTSLESIAILIFLHVGEMLYVLKTSTNILTLTL